MNKTYPINQRIHHRINRTKEYETKLSLWITIAAFLMTIFLALLIAYGLPTGPTWIDYIRNIVIAICLNGILFYLFSFLISIILSYSNMRLPFFTVSTLLYTGLVYGITLHYEKSGMTFSILIGILIVSFTIFLGIFMYILLRKKISRNIIISILIFASIVSIWQEGIYWERNASTRLLDEESEYGIYEVDSLTYGSGTDKHRKEYAKDVTEITPSVDASDFITKWGNKRADFWGFGPENFPINGRAFLPQGEGPFPVILMVHGNHTMEHLSTAGYDYLGETLASQGFFFVSVDEDFVNYSNYTGQPNDNYLLRTWLLLQHLIQLHEMNDDPNSVFYQKLNMDAVALSGHSRGGQAAAMAADYHRFFDDEKLLHALEPINIRGVAAVSPTDKSIDSQRANLENVSYFSIHGAQDADVFNFRGDDQFYRTNVSNDDSLFKATAYIEHANHVQFNTDWGRYDLSLPKGMFLNQGTLMSAKAQQQIAKVYLSAFYQAVFKEDTSFDEQLASKRQVGNILPDVTIIEKYRSHAYRSLVQYNKHTELIGEFNHFTKQEVIRPKNRSGGSHVNEVLQLSWDGTASYSLSLADLALNNEVNLIANNLIFTLANRSAHDDVEMHVKIEDEVGLLTEKTVLLSRAIDIKQTRFGLFDSIYRDGKYEVSSEAIFESIVVPLDDVLVTPWSDATIQVDFIGENGEIMIEEIAVE
ncbi:MAG TPA: hypothetical protein VK067_06790 [Pseudogracilibacillus sp.]|nr:hypothetical protein [Pseudogracilibacillus sp.]